MKVKTLTTLLLAFSMSCLPAQSDSARMVSFNMILSIPSADFTDFNEQTRNLNLPALENQLVGIGGEFQFQEGRWLNSFGFVWFEGGTEEQTFGPSGLVSYTHFEIPNRIGYDLIRSPDWVLSPEIGISFRWSRIGLSTAARAVTVGQALDTEIQQLESFDVPAELSLQVQRSFTFDEDGTGLLLGLRGGYRLDDSEWKVEGTVPLSDPGIDYNGLFFEFRLGIRGPWSDSRR